ncbi:branched-chain amino acid ABC transporter permease [Lichenihabitans sp. PAMC28606]|uniref:ABC transporter permease subunit n=1 Tax=Lichenihabitans sp. PAMC28606 TaxID=2880932 RepID=UPI001D0A4EBF|nr:branched-chain amino acid ABC transporter permease [Lichenihabitans sp. PAMC28606]UDL95655.1 branched-chain amino acid ABC transporter permease [Lichenihabitans sp. PAMC28606]
MRRFPLPMPVVLLGLLAAVLVGVAPQLVDTFTLMQWTVFLAMGVLALSLGFIWGFGGILSFGQAAFFGLGGYAYAVAAFNFPTSVVPLICAVLVPTVFAALLGYFMFYGRISNVYVGVITLTVTLILFNVFNSTAGDAYRIGAAALGGFNGIPSVPGITLPLNDYAFAPEDNWYLTGGCLIAIFLGLRLLLASHFGRVVVAIRENETRASLLGYDPRLYKLLAFVIGGGIAGLAGCLYTLWGAFISPTIFGLATSAQIIIWVMIGGLGTLIGPVLGAIAIQELITAIGTQQALDANLVLGIILLVFVLLMPAGVVPVVERLTSRLWRGRKLSRAAVVAAARDEIAVPMVEPPGGAPARAGE